MERWGFLAERPQGATDAYVVSRGVLLLRTLFGVQLWGSPHKIHNFFLNRNEQAPAFTTNILTQILDTCTFLYKGGLTVTASASFAEDFERRRESGNRAHLGVVRFSRAHLGVVLARGCCC